MEEITRRIRRMMGKQARKWYNTK